MKDTEQERQIRREIQQISKLLRKVTPEVLVLVPELLTDEMNFRDGQMKGVTYE